MSDAPRRLIEIGTLPSGFDATFIAEGGADPLAVMLREANARLDREHAEAERVRMLAIADVERARSTRSARAARRFRRALRLIGFRGPR
jgi:hypothetical protein